jgi:hypothetical protein
MKYAARALGASVAIFTILIAYAVARYPGGTWADHGTRGYDPLHNFICDLIEPIALDGETNAASARAAITAIVVLSAGLALTWSLLPAFFPPDARRLGVVVRALGIVSTLGIVAVPLTPAKSWYWSHAGAVLFAGASGLAAAATSVVGLTRSRDARALAALGCFVVAVVLVDVALYVHQLIVVGNPSIWLSLLEVVATVALLAWLGAIALRWRRIGG